MRGFRCYAPLHRSGFLQRIELAQVPGYASHAGVDDGHWVTRHPLDSKSEVIGIYLNAKGDREAGVFLDARSSVWPELAAAGIDAEVDFDSWTPTETFARTMTLAAKTKDAPVLSGYYGFACQHLSFMSAPPTPENLELSAARELPELPAAVRASKGDWIDERFAMPPDPEMVMHAPPEAKAFIEWWSAPVRAG